MTSAFKPRLVQPDPPTDEPTLDRLLATRTRLARETAANKAEIDDFCRRWSAEQRCTVVGAEGVKRAMQFGRVE